jgi:hypothetical protein
MRLAWTEHPSRARELVRPRNHGLLENRYPRRNEVGLNALLPVVEHPTDLPELVDVGRRLFIREGNVLINKLDATGWHVLGKLVGAGIGHLVVLDGGEELALGEANDSGLQILEADVTKHISQQVCARLSYRLGILGTPIDTA